MAGNCGIQPGHCFLQGSSFRIPLAEGDLVILQKRFEKRAILLDTVKMYLLANHNSEHFIHLRPPERVRVPGISGSPLLQSGTHGIQQILVIIGFGSGLHDLTDLAEDNIQHGVLTGLGVIAQLGILLVVVHQQAKLISQNIAQQELHIRLSLPGRQLVSEGLDNGVHQSGDLAGVALAVGQRVVVIGKNRYEIYSRGKNRTCTSIA